MCFVYHNFMKIKRIILKNFCSHKNTDIEFDDSPITIITGDTGAGKSSILDGISFALYQKVPRYNDKEVNKVKLESSMDDEETKVEVHITKNGNEFKISRILRNNQEYEVLFEEQNKKKTGKKTELDKEIIRQITGVDFDIFSRTIILPQGRFADFLKSDSPSEKREIIKGIFPELNVYSRIEEEISNEYKKIWDALELKNGEIESDKKRKESELSEMTEILKSFGIEENFTEDEIDKLYERVKNLYNKKLLELEEKNKEITSTLDEYKLYQHTLVQILKLNEDIGRLSFSMENDLSKLKGIALETDLPNQLKDRILDLVNTKNYSLVNEVVVILNDEIDKLNSLVGEIKQAKVNYENKRENYQTLKSDYERIIKRIEEITGIRISSARDGFKELDSYILSLEKNLESLNTKLSEFGEDKLRDEITILSHLKRDLNEVEDLERKIQSYENELKNKESILQVERKNLEKLVEEEKECLQEEVKYYSLYIRKNLNEGDTCPVCGNIFSSKVTEQIKGIDSEGLVTFKSKLEDIRGKADHTKRVIAKLEAEIDNLMNQIKDCDRDRSTKVSELSSKGIKSLMDIEDLEDKLKAREKEFKESRAMRDKLDKELHSLHREYEIMEERYQEIEKNEVELHEFKNEFLRSFQYLNLGDAKSVKLSNFFEEETYNEINNYLNKQAKVLSVLKNFLGMLTEISKNFSRIEENKKILESITKGVPEQVLNMEIDKLSELIKENEERLREISKFKENLSKLLGEIESRIRSIKNRIQEINDKEKEREDLEKEFNVISKLKDRFKANEIINFVTKVKMQDIVEVANEYLKMMGIQDKKLEVNISSNSLDFDVMYSDGNRNSVKSLSGGESFLFSIALAFSVSNEILSKNSIKTLFIDEGFDTLDEGYNSKIFQFLENYSQERDVKIFIITHKREISDSTNYRKIFVFKEGNISKVRFAD